MLRNIQKRLKDRKGFTLIELIVVMAILGIIAAIAVPSLSGTKDSAKRKADEISVKTINKAIQMYKVETDDEDLSDLESGSGNDKITATDSVTDMVTVLKNKKYLEDDFSLNNADNYKINTTSKLLEKK